MNDMSMRRRAATVPPADRAFLMNIAYRLLGSVAEAEDAVQEAYARWYALAEEQRADVRVPAAWLTTTVSRICLDLLGSARSRRERYVGEWLPEPVPSSASWIGRGHQVEDPGELAVLDDSLSMALLVVLETLSPAERVAFVLHDVFGYPHAEIAKILNRTPHACRQLASQARGKAHRERSADARHSHVERTRHNQVLEAFKNAWQSGDIEKLIRLLDPDAIAITDGGGNVYAARKPIVGAEAIIGFVLGVFERRPDLTISTTIVNGQPGLITQDGSGTTRAVLSFVVSNGTIRRVWVMRNPEKLTRWQQGG